MPPTFDDQKRQKLARFLERRNLKERAVELIAKAFRDNDLSRGDLTLAQNPTYAVIVQNLLKALEGDWITIAATTDLLEQSELAGRQHVCVYTLPDSGANAVHNAIRDPMGVDDSAATIDDYLDIPEASYARIIKSTANTAIVKIVTPRKYWRAQVDPAYSTDEEEWVRRWRITERSAVVIKSDSTTGVVQIRVPPRENFNQAETGKSIYLFLREILGSHYDLEVKGSWLSKLVKLPITDAFPTILENREDFVLRHDTPESDTAKTRVSRLGKIRDLEDLRDDPMWKFADGYSRDSMRGSWIVDENPIYAHLNSDSVRANGTATTVDFARIFFPHLATDSEVDHVVKRIIEHI